MSALPLLLSVALTWTSPELSLTPPSSEPTYTFYDLSYPGAAYDGTNTLVVWEDDRYPQGVYATRISASGGVLDPVGIRIAVRGGRPAVAFDGSRYLVVYEGDTHDVEGVRVGTDGVVIDTSPIVIADTASSPESPSVSFDGTNFVVAFGEPGGGPIEVVRVGGNGTVVDTTPIRVVNNAQLDIFDHRAVDSVSIVGTTLLTWAVTTTNGCEVQAARISSNGALVDTTPLSLGSSSVSFYDCAPYPAASSNDFAVSWIGKVGSSPDARIQLSRVGGTGAAIPSVEVSTETVLDHPAVSFTGGSWLVTWYRLQQLHAVRMTTAGAALDSAPVTLDLGGARVNDPILVPTGAVATAVFARKMQGWSWWTVGAAPITSSTTATPSAGAVSLVSRTSPAQASISLASVGDEALAVWVEHPGDVDRRRVMGAMIARDGQPRGAFEVGVGADVAYSARTAFDGTNYVVAWDQYIGLDGGFDIHATRVRPDGGLADSASFKVRGGTADSRSPRLAAGNGNALICWDENKVLQCARLAQDGGTSSVFSTPTGNLYSARFDVAWNGENFLVAWEDDPITGNASLRALRFTPSGTALTPNGVLASYTGLSVGDVAASGTPGGGYVVVYRDDGFSNDTLRMLRLNSDAGLTPSGSSPSVASGELGNVAVTWSEGAYLVGWTESRSGTLDDVLVRRFSDAGVDLDAQPLIVTSQLDNEDSVALAALGGAAAVGYIREDPSSAQQQPRARMKLFSSLLAPGAVCASGSECGSGACVGNVCCTTTCAGSCATGVCTTPTTNDAGTGADAGSGTDDAGTGGGDGGSTGAAVAFTSSAPRDARCNESWSYTPATNGTPPVLLSLSSAPSGMSVSNGTLNWTPGPGDVGMHSVQLIANAADGFAQQSFEVEVSCEEPAVNPTGCGCGSAGAVPLALFAVLGLLRRSKNKGRGT